MDFARYSINRPVNTWLIVLIFLVGGIAAFFDLGRLEDPEFTIKTAKVFTPYPGATALEVEEEVTDRLEIAVQQLKQLDEVKSKSSPGMSEVTVDILTKYDSRDLPQIWDELRRKLKDVESELPPGAGPIIINDDFGDVFGIYFAVIGDGHTYRDLKDYAKLLRKQLLLVDGVGKVEIAGDQQEQIFVEISLKRLGELGIPPQRLFDLLTTQNNVTSAGRAQVGDDLIAIEPTGTFSSVNQIANLLVNVGASDTLIRLGDIATIRRGLQEVPDHVIRFNGQKAITLGLSGKSGVNVVDLGARVDAKLAELEAITPIGITINPIFEQPKIVDNAVNEFVLSLGEAVAIVIVVLLLFMGLRPGIIIGAILFLSVTGTFIFMKIFGIDLQRVSLGALVIALGMLVDNAIVVAEGILIRIQKGEDSLKAASSVVFQTRWPLLGATIVGIVAFAPIGLSQDDTGEFTGSLFWVILISLLLSWVLAVLVTPLLCHKYFKPSKSGPRSDPYGHLIYRAYRGLLGKLIRARWLTVCVAILLLMAAGYGFTFVNQSFFPNSNTPIFFVDYWRAQGTDIRATDRDMAKIEDHILGLDDVVNVTTLVGHGATRFTLTYTQEQPNNSYGQFIVQVSDVSKIDGVLSKVEAYLASEFPQAEPKTNKLRIGPGRAAKIEARISGPDPAVLRGLSHRVQEIMFNDGGAKDLRDDWRQRELVARPVFSEAQARTTGISKHDLNEALRMAFQGFDVGIYREGDELIPIVVRAPDAERLNIGSISTVPIWSPIKQTPVPIGQVVSEFRTDSADTLVRRNDRIRTITPSANPISGKDGAASALFERLRPQIEAIDLPPGYFLEWGGEFEDSRDAQVALAKQLPVGFIAMIVIVVLLFGKVRQPLIIWLTVPLAIIGVTIGLLGTDGAFGFMALLGLLSLTGMLIKNAIVLIDQIDLEISEGKDPYLAVTDSAVSRVRPVCLAAFTTVLGMIPLLGDGFFVDMAVTIMGGLSFATVLTLLVVPVLYVIFFRIPSPIEPSVELN